ncbi:MAG TPA: hypothetical protein VNJ10_04525 [Sphingomonas sp.]|nr:hypothetical protein [Sphingomonas sp.]
MIDYHTPRFKSSQVAAAANLEINRFRTFFKRGQFTLDSDTGKPAAVHGVAHLWSLRDAMGFAIAGDLIHAGADASPAFKAGMSFAHLGSMTFDPPIPGTPPAREPGELWDARVVGFTFMAFFPISGGMKLFPTFHQIDMSDVIYDPISRSRAPCILLFLNDIESRVFEVLGINRTAE